MDNFREFRRVALEHPAVGRLLVYRLTRTSTVSLLSPAVRAVRDLKPARSMPNLSSRPAVSVTISDSV